MFRVPKTRRVKKAEGDEVFTKTDLSAIEEVGERLDRGRLRTRQLNIATTPIFAAAEDVFTPAELEARVSLMVHRFAIGRLIFTGEKDREARAARRPPRGKERNPECWACGCRAPQQSCNNAAGWRVRHADLGGDTRETYCGDCFREWGWPAEVISAK